MPTMVNFSVLVQLRGSMVSLVGVGINRFPDSSRRPDWRCPAAVSQSVGVGDVFSDIWTSISGEGMLCLNMCNKL